MQDLYHQQSGYLVIVSLCSPSTVLYYGYYGIPRSPIQVLFVRAPVSAVLGF